MKIKINGILLIAYLIAISFVTKKIEFLAIGAAVLLIFFGSKIKEEIKNLLYIIAALLPFPSFLAIFLMYIPFSAFGILISNVNFIKRYIFGFAIAVFSTLLIYTLSMFVNFSLDPVIIFIVMYIPAALMAFKLYKKKSLSSIATIDSSSYKIIIISLFFLFLITNVMLTDNTLFQSNGTYFYSKYYTIVKSVERGNTFPFYSPESAQGEQLFLVDSPAFFSHIAFVKVIMPWTNPVAFFNYYSAFILFLTILGVSLLIKEIVSEKERNSTIYTVAIGSSVAILSFIFIQYLESVKQFFAHPIGFLIFALILSNPKKVQEILLIGALFVLMLLIHPPQALGTGLVAIFLFLFMQLDKQSMLRNLNELKNHLQEDKLKLFILVVIVLLIPIFYIIPIMQYSDYMRPSGSSDPGVVISNAAAYLDSFFTNENPLSVKYPDTRRIDHKKIGFFISGLGLLALAYSLFNIRKPYFRKANVFTFAYFSNILASAIIISMPFVGNMEYGNRTLIPYALVLLVVLICTSINSFRNSIVRWLLLAVLLAGFIHSIPFVKENLSNIHQESFIGGQTYKNDIEFIKTLPIDGRIITYGHFANAVDAGLHALTDHYLSKFEFKQIDTTKTVYDKIHSTHSWGVNENIDKMSGTEFANYLRVGGYKYIFANICHPVGNKVVNKLYPDFIYPIYQNQQNQCNVIFTVNSTYYAEKVNLDNEEPETRLKREDGYWHVSINEEYDYGDIKISEHDGKILAQEPVNVERLDFSTVILRGDFSKGQFVVFKEQYFPKWKAYMGGKEVPVVSTDNYLLLIQTTDGNEILLKNTLLPFEKISGLVSSIAIIALLLFFIFII
jgi:hypothetical protein